MGLKEDMEVMRIGGEKLVSHKPFFTWDSKHLLVICGNRVKVYSLAGSGCVQVLEGHQADITFILQNPHNRFQVITGSLDSTLRCWSYEGGVQLWFLTCPCPVILLHPFEGDAEDEEGVKGRKRKSVPINDEDDVADDTKKNAYFSCYAVVRSKVDLEDLTVVKMKLLERVEEGGKERQGVEKEVREGGEWVVWLSFRAPSNHICIGNKDTLLVHANGTSSIEAHNLKKLTSYRHKLPHKQRLSIMALHPNKPILAAGLMNGAILIYSNAASHQHVCTTLHWHSLPLPALSFTPDGSSLLSGGHECVLVAWSMSNHSKRTLPRLPSPILHISSSPNCSLYALSHVDNGIQLVSNTWNMVQCIQGLCSSSLGHLDNRAGGAGGDEEGEIGVRDGGEKISKKKSGKDTKNEKDHKSDNINNNININNNSDNINNNKNMLVDNKAGLLVMRGFQGRLQFYDVINDQHAYSVDITNENYISPESLTRPVSFSYIDHMTLSEDGDWLITGQSLTYEDGGGVDGVFVKFWKRTADGSLSLSTSAKDPHKAKSCSSVCKNCPITRHPYFVTMATSKQASFIVWKLMSQQDDEKEQKHWQGVFVGSFNNLLPSHITLNINGSVLAVVYQNTYVTFWDPIDLVMTYKMTFPKPIRRVTFSEDLDCMYFTSSQQLSHWSPVLREQWHADTQVTCMLVSPHNHLVTFTSDFMIEVYKSSSNQPIMSFHLNSSHPISDACFLNNQLYFFNTQQQLYTLFQPELQTKKNVPSTTKDFPSLILPPTLPSTHHHPTSTPSNHKLNDQFMKYLLDTPGHLIAPSKTWCLQYLSTLLPS